jgi:hypothetical protein
MRTQGLPPVPGDDTVDFSSSSTASCSLPSRSTANCGQSWPTLILLVMHRPSVPGNRPSAHVRRLSDKVSDNRHSQRRTPANTHERSVAGHACYGAGSPHLCLASGRRGPCVSGPGVDQGLDRLAILTAGLLPPLTSRAPARTICHVRPAGGRLLGLGGSRG